MRPTPADHAPDALAKIAATSRLLGFLGEDAETWFKGGADEELSTRVEALIAARAEARRAKDWPQADRLRTELADLNVEVLDGPGGTATWRLKG